MSQSQARGAAAQGELIPGADDQAISVTIDLHRPCPGLQIRRRLVTQYPQDNWTPWVTFLECENNRLAYMRAVKIDHGARTHRALLGTRRNADMRRASGDRDQFPYCHHRLRCPAIQGFVGIS